MTGDAIGNLTEKTTCSNAALSYDWRRSYRYRVSLVVGNGSTSKDRLAMMCLRLYDSRVKSCKFISF